MRSGFSTCSNGSVSISGVSNADAEEQETDTLEPHERSPAARRGRSGREKQQDQHPREERNRPDVRADECRVRTSRERARFRDESCGSHTPWRTRRRRGRPRRRRRASRWDFRVVCLATIEPTAVNAMAGTSTMASSQRPSIDAEGERARGEREGQAEGRPGERRAHAGRDGVPRSTDSRPRRTRAPALWTRSVSWVEGCPVTVPGPLRRP